MVDGAAGVGRKYFVSLILSDGVGGGFGWWELRWGEEFQVNRG